MVFAKCGSRLVLRIVLDTTEIVGIRFRPCAKKCTATSTDVFDNFTDKLVEEKATKWRRIRSAGPKEKSSLSVTNHNRTYMFTDNLESLDKLLFKAINSNQFECAISLLKTPQQTKEYPSSKVLLQAASFFGRSGNKNGLKLVQKLCEQCDKEEFNNQAQYKHYLAEATWKNGNIEAALNIFAEVYRSHSALRRKIRTMTRFLFSECILHKSEASVVLIKKFAHTLAEEYGDLFFLSCLWQYCFVSEWFSDQQLAGELLKENEKLREHIKERVQHVALEALNSHQVNVVHRILEFLLLYDMKPQYSESLRALFDYKSCQGDVKGCIAILESALQLKISMSVVEQLNFLYLLATDQERIKIKELTKQFQLRSVIVPPFNLKF